MNVDVTTEIDINRPRAEVAVYAADPDNTTTWYNDIKAVRWETPRPVQVGSRIAFEAHFLGRRLAYTYEVRALEPNVCLVMSTDQGPFPMETTYTWKDISSGGTHMTLRNRGQPSGFANLAAPIMSAQIRKATTRNLALLKKILEARPKCRCGDHPASVVCAAIVGARKESDLP